MQNYCNLLTVALCGLGSLTVPAATQLLYQNGTFVTAVNAGYGGADLSVVQDPTASSTNTLATTGWHNDVARPTGWRMTSPCRQAAGTWAG